MHSPEGVLPWAAQADCVEGQYFARQKWLTVASEGKQRERMTQRMGMGENAIEREADRVEIKGRLLVLRFTDVHKLM